MFVFFACKQSQNATKLEDLKGLNIFCAAEASQSPVDEMPPSPTGHHDAMGTGHRLLKQISACDARLY